MRFPASGCRERLVGASGLLWADGAAGFLLKIWIDHRRGRTRQVRCVRAEEWAQDKGGQSPRSPFLLLRMEFLLRSPSPGTAVAAHLPPRDFLSVFLSAHRHHLRAGPPRRGPSHSAAPHSQGGPGAARQQVFVVKGTGRKRRAPAFCSLTRGHVGFLAWKFLTGSEPDGYKEDIHGSPLRRTQSRGQGLICEPGGLRVSLLWQNRVFSCVLTETVSLLGIGSLGFSSS